MTVEHAHIPFLSTTQLLFPDESVINHLALAAVVHSVATGTESVVDHVALHLQTRQGIEQALNGVGDDAIEFVTQALNELKDAVVARLTGTVRVKVMGITYDDNGDITDIATKVALG